MKRIYWIAVTVAALAAGGGVAGEPAEQPMAKPAKEMTTQDMCVVGTITKHENKKKDGSPMMTWYNLTDEQGQEIRLPKDKVADYVGGKVKVTGTGYTLEKKGKAVRAFKTITTIEKIENPAK